MAKRTAMLGRAVQAADAAGVNDRDLLRRFTDEADQSAFAAVVKRHSALVYGVCVRVLHSDADADDATQAVFLVLAKKAKGTRWQSSIANWLYTTARKVAANARLAAARRSKREGAAAVPEGVSPADAMSGRELVAALDDELDKLAPRYREPLVLCYLEGLTRDDAAARLGLAVPALNKQLERGRKKLADALAARGCALGVLLLAVAATSTATAAPNTVASVLTAVGGKPSAAAVALAQGLTMNTAFTRAKFTALALVGLTLGLGAVAAMPSPSDPPKPDKVEKKADPKADSKPADAKPVTVSGTVVGPDGKPVAGAILRMPDTVDIKKALLANAPMKMSVVEVGKTDPDGKFMVTVPPLPGGTPDYRQLVAVKPGFGPAWIDVRELTDAPVTLQLVTDDVPVKGRITDLEGKPVAKAKVELKYVMAGDLAKVWGVWARRPEWALQPLKTMWAELGGLPANVTADADGKFEITGVGRGRLLAFSVEAPGIETAGCRVVTDTKFDPKTVEQPSQDTMPGGAYMPGPALYGATFTHTAKPSQPIVGVVTDGKTGKPIAGVQVNGHPDGPHWYENGSSVFTDADGKFTMHGVAKTDRVRLMVFPTPKQPYFQYTTTVASKPGLTEIPVELKLTKGVMVKGRVTEKGSGAPVAGAGIRYTALADNKHYAELMSGKRGESGMAWNSDADGRFEFIALPGSGVVTAQGETRGRQRGTDYTQVRVAKDDLPKAYGRDQESLGESFTAADGHFVTLFSLSGYKIIDPKPTDDTVEVEIVFECGKSVSGKVVDADGKPAAGVTAYKLTACYDVPQKLKDGSFTATALESDHPRTVLFADEAKKLAASIDLKGDEKDVTVKLQPWGKIGGRLLDAEGKPLAGATVTTFPKNGMKHMAFTAVVQQRAATTDKDGKFTLEVPAGPAEYILGFGLKNKYLDVGFRPTLPGHTVKPGETTDVGDVKVKGE
jgi:RNA polymerase sigma factor (sigma-70 family)